MVPKKYVILLLVGMAILGLAFTFYSVGGGLFVSGSQSNNGFVPFTGYETYFLLAILLAPVGCVCFLAGLIGLIDRAFPSDND